MNLPFRTVRTPSSADSHLVLSSPALPGHHPDQLHPNTLCGQPVAGPAGTPVGDVECRRCLFSTPGHLALPGFRVTA